MKPRASIRLFSARGVPVYAHITLPLGLALVSGFSFRPLIAAFNLLPIRGLDGNEAWSILRLTYLRLKQAWLRRKLSRRIHSSKSGRKS